MNRKLFLVLMVILMAFMAGAFGASAGRASPAAAPGDSGSSPQAQGAAGSAGSAPQLQPDYQDVPTTSNYYPYLHDLTFDGIVGGYACGSVGEPCVPPGNLPYYRPGNLV